MLEQEQLFLCQLQIPEICPIGGHFGNEANLHFMKQFIVFPKIKTEVAFVCPRK